MTEQQIKAAVRARDGFRCTECRMSEADHYAKYGRNLEVHRLNPGGPYTLEGCVTLCAACHGPKPKRPAVPGSKADTLFVWLPASLKDRLVRLARLRSRTISAEATLAIRQHVAEGIKPPPPAPEASP